MVKVNVCGTGPAVVVGVATGTVDAGGWIDGPVVRSLTAGPDAMSAPQPASAKATQATDKA
ncbi:hypothetical protein Asi02nite_55040 [Asanoa siamensis]|uniref:Uncharacterized protein n=1 Tax=Asanoa siamensis TaxID=926357 RepID=A0ABQ4CXG6_9ACTN|nr:hypothetical protein Asi02nite_55040 [Asanoa siamensis]